jgi:hypothetical protein
MDMDEILQKCHSYIDNILMPIVKSCNEHLECHIFDDDPHFPNIFLPKRQNIIIVIFHYIYLKFIYYIYILYLYNLNNINPIRFNIYI